MEWLIDNWFILVGVLAILVFVVVYCWKFTGMPTTEQIMCVKEWLKYAVAMAEKELQSGTGQLKLRLVYQRFIETFPAIAKVVSFEVFSESFYVFADIFKLYHLRFYRGYPFKIFCEIL